MILRQMYIRNVHSYKYKKYATIYWFSCISIFLKYIQDIRMVLMLALSIYHDKHEERRTLFLICRY